METLLKHSLLLSVEEDSTETLLKHSLLLSVEEDSTETLLKHSLLLSVEEDDSEGLLKHSLLITHGTVYGNLVYSSVDFFTCEDNTATKEAWNTVAYGEGWRDYLFPDAMPGPYLVSSLVAPVIPLTFVSFTYTGIPAIDNMWPWNRPNTLLVRI